MIDGAISQTICRTGCESHPVRQMVWLMAPSKYDVFVNLIFTSESAVAGRQRQQERWPIAPA